MPLASTPDLLSLTSSLRIDQAPDRGPLKHVWKCRERLPCTDEQVHSAKDRLLLAPLEGTIAKTQGIARAAHVLGAWGRILYLRSHIVIVITGSVAGRRKDPHSFIGISGKPLFWIFIQRLFFLGPKQEFMNLAPEHTPE